MGRQGQGARPSPSGKCEVSLEQAPSQPSRSFRGWHCLSPTTPKKTVFFSFFSKSRDPLLSFHQMQSKNEFGAQNCILLQCIAIREFLLQFGGDPLPNDVSISVANILLNRCWLLLVNGLGVWHKNLWGVDFIPSKVWYSIFAHSFAHSFIFPW